ncbi:hypothetical protein [Mumia zhuanghuii]|uniref:Uncharacterized protein n=1 Tax=Mumia zhuanghuii TaxID=2585211 RepID=A0A5C4MAA4_9ACTN|nr:hypothetical protein [Mumia zhuanghuii]TNC32525.1 hypothetical protein FHE65_30365 [Mumia zhuanghuii]
MEPPAYSFSLKFRAFFARTVFHAAVQQFLMQRKGDRRQREHGKWRTTHGERQEPRLKRRL